MATATLSLLNPPLTQDNDEWLTIAWDGTVTGFAFSEAVITGDCTIESTDFTQSGDSYYVRVHTADQADGTITVSLAQDVVNEGNPAVTRTFTWGNPPTTATITLSTTDTDIRAGGTVSIDIDSNIDITLTAANITVTGGTRGALTGSGQSYQLSVTAGAAGTLTVAITEDAVPEGNAAVSEDFTIAANYQLHIADGSNDNISVIGYDTADGDTADALRTYTTTDSTDVQSIVYDGSHIHITNWQQSTVRVYATNTANGGAAAVVRAYTVTGISQPSGMAFDGTNLHIADRATDNIRVIAPDTADGGTATILRTYEVTGLDDCRGMMFDGENIHAVDYTDDNIRVFAPDTPNNGTATVLRTYTVPGVNHSRSIAFDGVNIHVSDVTDDNFRVVAVPTAGGAQTVLRTYEVTDVANPRGMTGVPLSPNNAPEFAQASYTFDDDVGVAVNTAIGSVVATDADMDTLSYSLTGTDASRFAIDANGQITIATALSYATTYNVNVVADDTQDTASVPVSITTLTQANLTITTSHGTIYEEQSVIFQIASDIDITNFTLSDIDTTGASHVGLSTFGERMWRLQTTADAGAGDIVISIAENVVSPGNVAVSETFTRIALAATTLEVVSGDNQSGQVGNALANPLTVQVNDQNGDAFAGATVTFATTGGTLSTASATTGANGQASTSLTLPNTAGEYTVTASVSGLADVTFTATASAVPLVATTLEIVSGDNQSATVSTALPNPLVVQVLDQNGDAFSGSTVTFSTTGGTLSETSVTTGANGQASTALTLGNMAGSYTVTASVSGLTDVSFTATATATLPVAIEVIDEQTFILGTDYEIDVDIQGNPTEVTVEGSWDGWLYDWDGTNGVLSISGTANSPASGETWAVAASRPGSSDMQDIVFNSVMAAPVITEPVNLTITAGTDYNANPISILISNSPSAVTLQGLLLGLDYEITNTGVNIVGMLPTDADLTVDSGTLTITASNNGGEDTVTPTFTIN